ncbi:MAG: hypothetical protein R3D26_17495 [Cyanobacteriota/Melainabacteria group bacterium]
MLRTIYPELKNKTIPKTFAAGIEKGVYFSVSPAVYARIYPQGEDPDAFEKLFTHELAHRLHVRILDGDEERMGPIWFFEGFATIASGQFEKNKADLSAEEIAKLLDQKRARLLSEVQQTAQTLPQAIYHLPGIEKFY